MVSRTDFNVQSTKNMLLNWLTTHHTDVRISTASDRRGHQGMAGSSPGPLQWQLPWQGRVEVCVWGGETEIRNLR